MMELALIALLVLTLGAASMFMLKTGPPAPAKQWERAARVLGLTLHEEFLMAGRIDGRSVRVRRADQYIGLTVFELFTDRLDLEPLILQRGDGSLPAGHGGEVPIVGDPVFDRAVRAVGPAGLISAALDVQARHAVRSLVEDHGGSLRDGILRVELPMVKKTQRLVETVKAMQAVALALDFREEWPGQRLTRIVMEDRLITVRRRALEVLVAEHPAEDETAVTCRAMLDHPDPALRLGAALFLGDKGRQALLALSQDATASASHRIGALDGWLLAVGRPAPADRNLVLALLDDPNLAVATQAARYAGQWSLSAAGPSLARLAANGTSPETRTTALHGLGRVAGPEQLPAIVACLDDPLSDVVVAAVLALQKVGGIDQVEPLMRIEKQGTPPAKRAAILARRAIQARAVGGEAGSLAVVEPGQGASPGGLSLPVLEGGLSEVPDGKGGKGGTRSSR